MIRLILGTVFGSVLLVGLGLHPATAQHGHDNHDHRGHAHRGDHDNGGHAEVVAPPNCPVMDEPANLALSVATDDGPVYFCCKGCIPKFQKNPAKYVTKVAAQRKALAHREKVQVICPVTKEPVDRKVSIERDGKTVYLCCKGCVGKYGRDPAKYATALANSYTYQTTCPVMGEAINPKVSTVLSTGETIYYCCKGCDKPLRENPAKYNKNLVSQGVLVNWAEVKKADNEEGRGHEHGTHGDGDHGHGDHGDGVHGDRDHDHGHGG